MKNRSLKKLIVVVGIGLGIGGALTVQALAAKSRAAAPVAPAAPAAAPTPAANVGITRLDVTKRRPAFGGKSFGPAGPYEWVIGVAYGELDPKDPLNTRVVNLQYAPLNARGHVEYNVDVAFLKPVDMSKSNGRLIYDVLNRGHEKGLADVNLNHYDSVAPYDVEDLATGFYMKRGYTVAWSGWEAEDSAETSGATMKAHYPIPMRNGQSITGLSREEFSSVGRGATFTRTLTYPAATLDQSKATLTVRQLEADPRKPLPASSWSYIDNRHVRMAVAAGFDPEALYEFIYTAKDPVIEGLAFPSMRDFVFFVRDAEKDSMGQPNPIHPPTPFKAVIALGVSQSGRFLKDFVYQNFHVNSSGRKVFDGIVDVVGGGRRTDINAEFAQPGRFSRQHEDHLYPDTSFPFTYATTTDPLTKQTDGIQVTCAKNHTCPPTMHIDTNTELWIARGSLTFTTPDGMPVALPDNVRVYILTGIPHNNRDLGDQWAAEGIPEYGICRQLRNPLNYRHYVRAFLVAMDEWVTAGVAPPASRYPNFKDGTLVTLDEAEKLWPAIPDVPFSRKMSTFQVTDYSKQPPVPSGPQYPLFLSKTDADGNPMGGVVPPEISVPIATYVARNTRAKGFAEGDLCAIHGSYLPLPITKAERLEKKDPRPSLEERYKGQADFSAKRKVAADALVKARLLLAEDVPYFTDVKLPTKPIPAAKR